LSPHEKHLFKLYLLPYFKVLKEFAHDSIILGDLILKSFNSDNGKDFFRVRRKSDALLRIMHIEHFLLLCPRYNRVL